MRVVAFKEIVSPKTMADFKDGSLFEKGYVIPYVEGGAQCRHFFREKAMKLAELMKVYDTDSSLFRVHRSTSGDYYVTGDGQHREFVMLLMIHLESAGYSLDMKVRVLVSKTPMVCLKSHFIKYDLECS
jgi:hypothetical protein